MNKSIVGSTAVNYSYMNCGLCFTGSVWDEILFSFADGGCGD